MGVGRSFFLAFFFFKLLPQLFQAANVNENNNSPPHTPTETIVIRSDSGKTGLAVPKATELKGLGIRWGEIVSSGRGLGPRTGKGEGADFVSIC